MVSHTHAHAQAQTIVLSLSHLPCWQFGATFLKDCAKAGSSVTSTLPDALAVSQRLLGRAISMLSPPASAQEAAELVACLEDSVILRRRAKQTAEAAAELGKIMELCRQVGCLPVPPLLVPAPLFSLCALKNASTQHALPTQSLIGALCQRSLMLEEDEKKSVLSSFSLAGVPTTTVHFLVACLFRFADLWRPCSACRTRQTPWTTQ